MSNEEFNLVFFDKELNEKCLSCLKKVETEYGDYIWSNSNFYHMKHATSEEFENFFIFVTIKELIYKIQKMFSDSNVTWENKSFRYICKNVSNVFDIITINKTLHKKIHILKIGIDKDFDSLHLMILSRYVWETVFSISLSPPHTILIYNLVSTQKSIIL